MNYLKKLNCKQIWCCLMFFILGLIIAKLYQNCTKLNNIETFALRRRGLNPKILRRIEPKASTGQEEKIEKFGPEPGLPLPSARCVQAEVASPKLSKSKVKQYEKEDIRTLYTKIKDGMGQEKWQRYWENYWKRINSGYEPGDWETFSLSYWSNWWVDGEVNDDTVIKYWTMDDDGAVDTAWIAGIPVDFLPLAYHYIKNDWDNSDRECIWKNCVSFPFGPISFMPDDYNTYQDSINWVRVNWCGGEGTLDGAALPPIISYSNKFGDSLPIYTFAEDNIKCPENCYYDQSTQSPGDPILASNMGWTEDKLGTFYKGSETTMEIAQNQPGCYCKNFSVADETWGDCS